MLGARPLCFPSLRDQRFIISCFPLSETVEYILYTCLFVNSEREKPNTSDFTNAELSQFLILFFLAYNIVETGRLKEMCLPFPPVDIL